VQATSARSPFSKPAFKRGDGFVPMMFINFQLFSKGEQTKPNSMSDLRIVSWFKAKVRSAGSRRFTVHSLWANGLSEKPTGS
jgi:hypothetical protein